MPHQARDQTAMEFEVLRLAIAQLISLILELLQRPVSIATQRFRSLLRNNSNERARPTVPDPVPRIGYCWDHTKSGSLVRRCRLPCSFPAQIAATNTS